jgi:hypothetical protein
MQIILCKIYFTYVLFVLETILLLCRSVIPYPGDGWVETQKISDTVGLGHESALSSRGTYVQMTGEDAGLRAL